MISQASQADPNLHSESSTSIDFSWSTPPALIPKSQFSIVPNLTRPRGMPPFNSESELMAESTSWAMPKPSSPQGGERALSSHQNDFSAISPSLPGYVETPNKGK